MTLFDSDHLTILTDQRHRLHDTLLNRLTGQDIAVPIVVAEEQARGFLALIHRYKEVERQLWGYDRLHSFLRVLQVTEIVPFDQAALEQYQVIATIRPRIGTQD